MTARYCDLALDFTNDAAAGDATGTPATGPGGMQSMIEGWGNHDALAAADIMDTKGTGDLSKLVKITVDDDKSGTWVIADAVQNHNDGGGSSGDDWVGKLVFIDATTVWVQINIASSDIASVDTADGIDNTTQTETIAGANMTAVEAPGIQLDNNQGTSSAMIEFVGVNSSWSEDGTFFKLDAKGLAANCILANNIDYIHLRNFDFDEATSHGLSTVNGNHSSKWIAVNGQIHDCAGDGVGRSANLANHIQGSFFIGVDMASNDVGFRALASFFQFCSFRDHTSHGLHVAQECTAMDCTFTGNGGFGVLGQIRTFLSRCVIADNTNDGFSTQLGTVNMASLCRITDSNSGSNPGIDADGHLLNLWNFFTGNSAPVVAATFELSTYKGVETEITTGNRGYEDKTSGKYSTLVGAAGYRTLLTMPDNLTRIAFGRGMPSMILPTIGDRG